MAKVILISQKSLPYNKIGSWTTLYKNYLEDNHSIDHIVCEKPSLDLFHVGYSFVQPTLYSKIKKRITKKHYLDYTEAVLKILDKKEKYIIQIVDNFGIVRPLQEELVKRGLRENCYIQFFYHGFSPFCKNIEDDWFFESVDEMILLTHASYLEHKKYYTALPTRFTVLHNGINIQKFYPLSPEIKKQIRTEKGIQDKKIFLWCSQDRPKKGLHIVLDAWKFIEEKYPEAELWIIGTEKKKDTDSVKYFGKIQNDLLPNFLQISDAFLFSSLCHEGFGMSLVEAMHCGNYCIASDNGGIAEVLQDGKFGKLIRYPNMVRQWVDAITEFIERPLIFDPLPTQLYSTEEWNSNMNRLITDAKKYLNS